MSVLLVITVTSFLLWTLISVLEKYNTIDYGYKPANALFGFNQLITRRYHRLGDFWLDIPSEGPVIIAANHQAGIDVAALMAASKRPLRFLASSYYCDNPILKRIMAFFGCIPVYKDKDNKVALHEAINVLQAGGVVCVFPFGGIHPPDKEEPRIRSGVAVLSKLANTPIYPVYIDGVSKFCHNRVFGSLFFVRNRLKLIQYKSILNASGDHTKVLDYLYKLLSNHNDKSEVAHYALNNFANTAVEKDAV